MERRHCLLSFFFVFGCQLSLRIAFGFVLCECVDMGRRFNYILLFHVGSVVSRIDSNGWLDLSGQNLTAIPDELRAVAGIVGLNVEDNQISELPDWLCEMTTLKVSYIQDKQRRK